LAGAALLGVSLSASLIGCDRTEAADEGHTRLDVDAADPFSQGEIPDFQLVSQTGAAVTKQDLAGEPFVLCAIFTSCAGPCPRISANMEKLQKELEGVKARLVSVSVDPETDTPEVLARYAASYHADPERWLFLTGHGDEVRSLVQGGLFLSAVRDPDKAAGERVTHDTRLVVVDRHGRRRGWYDGLGDQGCERAAARVRHLAEVDD